MRILISQNPCLPELSIVILKNQFCLFYEYHFLLKHKYSNQTPLSIILSLYMGKREIHTI